MIDPRPMSYIESVLYTNVVDLWILQPGGGTDPAQATYSPGPTGIPCIIADEPRTDVTTPAGEIPVGGATIQLPLINISPGWIITDRTLRRDGTKGANYGRVFIIDGDPATNELPGVGMEFVTARLKELLPNQVPDGVVVPT